MRLCRSRNLKTISRPVKWPLLAPIGQKMKIYNFELESILDLNYDVKFDGERDSDGHES